MTKASFKAFARGERVKGFSKGGEVKERELATNGIKSHTHLFGSFGFCTAGIETGLADKLHPFGWDVLRDEGDEIKRRKDDIPAPIPPPLPVGEEDLSE